MQPRERLGERLSGTGNPQHRRGKLGHHFLAESERSGIEGGIAHGLAAQGVEVSGKVAMGAVCLDQRHRRRDVEEVRLGLDHGRRPA